MKKQESIPSINKLMIVAHPDDETIWGGYHLLINRWFVVCLTGRDDDNPRGLEFHEIMNQTGNVGIMLGFPDTVSGKIDRWEHSQLTIEAELRSIITSKNWDIIVTHNPDGEYSHIHHILTSKIVSSITTENLYYFGRYYNKSDKMLNILPRLDDESVNKKRLLMSLYRSQSVSATAFDHMYAFEHFIPYAEWNRYKDSLLSKWWRKAVAVVDFFCKKILWHLTHKK